MRWTMDSYTPAGSRAGAGSEAVLGDGMPLPEELRGLAAVAGRPLGLPSRADVALAAGVSLDDACRALRTLRERGLGRLDNRMLPQLGQAVEGSVWVLDIRPGTVRLPPGPEAVDLPDPMEHRPSGVRAVPDRFWHHFWNAKPGALVLPRDAHYVADRLLLSEDVAAWAWALANLPVDPLARVARSRAVDPATRSMIRNYLAARS